MSSTEKTQSAATIEELNAAIERLQAEIQKESEARNYMKAHELQQQLFAHQKEIQDIKTKMVTDTHRAEDEALERAFKHLQMKFDEFWDEEMRKFEEESENQQISLIKQHENEQNALNKEFEKGNTTKRKESTDLQSMRKAEKNLAAQGRFKEAADMKKAADALNEKEKKRFEEAEKARQKALNQQLTTRQETELQGLKRRLARERTDLEKQRKTDFQVLKQRYDNLVQVETNKHKTTPLARAARQSGRETKTSPMRTASPRNTPTPTSSFSASATSASAAGKTQRPSSRRGGN